MKKYLSFLVLIFLAFFCIVGCDENTLDQIVYGECLLPTSEVVTNYDNARDLTAEISNVKFKTENKIIVGDQVIQHDVTTTLGKIRSNNKTFFTINATIFKNGEKQRIVEQYGSNGILITYFTYLKAQRTNYIATQSYDATVYTNNHIITQLLPSLNSDNIETLFTKEYKQNNYYRASLDITTMVPDFLNLSEAEALSLFTQIYQTTENGLFLSYNDDAELYDYGISSLFTKPDNTYPLSYVTEFGVTNRGYVDVFKFEYSLQDDDYNKYGTVTSKTTMLAYGADLGDVTMPAPLDPSKDLSSCVKNFINVVSSNTYYVSKIEYDNTGANFTRYDFGFNGLAFGQNTTVSVAGAESTTKKLTILNGTNQGNYSISGSTYTQISSANALEHEYPTNFIDKFVVKGVGSPTNNFQNKSMTYYRFIDSVTDSIFDIFVESNNDVERVACIDVSINGSVATSYYIVDYQTTIPMNITMNLNGLSQV